MNGYTYISISDLRKDAAEVLKNVVDKQKPAIILQRSKPRAILVDAKYFEALEEAYLDLTDAAEAERADKEDTVPFDDFLKKRFGTTKL
ncbi:hypothetical protein A3D77_03590 [Candidatus Gottesmanbacteria bacterium RIFCSPHIGHO2_02_FULL_39_11]|uniref:Antitoxin n=1 Tax=Candidatus Gottesmanbacteria bacterium RIFCSPHIGHO2_02_FULL_39_11 TaxID=1798382 RepID=A0A1F5ZNE3_9BACT|nr:MAG: hypothetical protein A3D77_03590 [Candidatus Gottesmanbacteria bacterium RIFCSPHIGHO2_02_FULL_39_11]